jgi:hypothetical protein
MTAGMLDVTNAVLGYRATGGTNCSGTAYGTLNVLGGTCVVQRLSLGVIESVSNAAPMVAQGIINLNTGTLRAGTLISPPPADLTGTNQAYFNWTNGTIGNITGGDLTISNVPLTLTTAGAHTFDADAGRTIALYSAVTGGVGVAFQKTGGGTLKFRAGNLVSSNLDLTLSGGTLDPGGFNQTLRKLTLNGDAVIDFGSGNSVLTFADSASQTWTGSLTVTNWSGLDGGGGDDRLFVGTNAAGLTTDQLNRITARGCVTRQLSTGEIVFRPRRGTMLGIY